MENETKYRWQKDVLEAFAASRDTLAAKINIAERAIAARLADAQQPELCERIALQDALRALQVLLAETKVKPAQPDSKKNEDIA